MRKFLLRTAAALCAFGLAGGASAQTGAAQAPGAATAPKPMPPNASYGVSGMGQPPAGASTSAAPAKAPALPYAPNAFYGVSGPAQPPAGASTTSASTTESRSR